MKVIASRDLNQTIRAGAVFELPTDKASQLIQAGHAQAFCYWLELPVKDCVYPCSRSKRGTEKECQHFRAYWKQRAGELPTPDLRPEQDEFSRLYKMHMERLRRYDLLPDEIEPSRLAEIHRAIEEMDSAWIKGDLTKFKEAMNETESLYFEAVKVNGSFRRTGQYDSLEVH